MIFAHMLIVIAGFILGALIIALVEHIKYRRQSR